MSQNQIEGSRVEFTCECQVQGNNEVWYQWLKDDTELQQQNNASLILDSVKMHDFGCYRCHISHRGGDGEAVTSEPAFLEVSPCEGKSEYCLEDVRAYCYCASLVRTLSMGTCVRPPPTERVVSFAAVFWDVTQRPHPKKRLGRRLPTVPPHAFQARKLNKT